jgi:hypothetical protein
MWEGEEVKEDILDPKSDFLFPSVYVFIISMDCGGDIGG